MSKITFELDGKSVEAAEGETIWQVAKRAGTTIPHLCYHDAPGYRADGNCRACVVEVEGVGFAVLDQHDADLTGEGRRLNFFKDKETAQTRLALFDGKDAYLDVEATEKAETQIDAFITKRSREKADANRVAEHWEESDRRDREKRRRENRQAWREYEIHMANLHASLAAEHAEKAEALSEEEFEAISQKKGGAH